MKAKTSCNVEETFILEVFLDSRQDEVAIEVTIGFDWQNDGIGPYEYWGAKGYDKGIDYLEAEEILWDKEGFTPAEIDEIEKEIKASLDKWSEKAQENAGQCEDFD